MIGAALSASLLFLAVAIPAVSAADRVDLFDLKGQRTGYAIVDREQGRVDLYDARSRRTGWGRITPAGRIELFGLDGKREGQATLPIGHKRRQ